ncbi:ATP-binding protein [Paraflavisolibacter sp. H34]|uniref:hybrid sensor histidine kinase/response regulator transcription factor n=1 Tax=Huijunlia imazamoxiresistens TaxID=3127457 RepID=UPI003018CE35
MEEHELHLQPSEGEVVAFAREVTDSFRDLSERKQIHLLFESSLDRLYTAFDRDKLERTLFNLLSNAFKFTLTGGTIRVALDPLLPATDPGRTWVSVKVSDTGIGIPEDKKQKIFDRFFQADSTAAVLNQGSGIGLSITREFVHLHGGTIAVDSEPGKGATFTIHLPFTPLAEPPLSTAEPVSFLAEAEREALPEPAENLPPPSAEPTALPAILLVEDNEDFRFYLKDNLKAHYKVYEAANGKEGWQKALTHHPQLIVSSSLYNKLLALTGQKPVEYIRSVKLDKAAVLLEKSHLNIAQVAYSTGFATPTYFAKAFKVKFNMLPSEYMTRMRKEPQSVQKKESGME